MPTPKKSTKGKGAKGLLFELDGGGVSPKTVDSLLLLNLATSFFQLIVKLAQLERTGLTLQGLRVVDKCVAVAVDPSDENSARVYSTRAKKIVSGAEPAPAGCVDLAKEIQCGIRSLPKGIKPAIRCTGVPLTLVAPALETSANAWETLDLRAVPLRVGGKTLTVELHSDSEGDTFVVKTGQEQGDSLRNARILGASLRKELDIALTVARGADGRICDGYISEVFELQDDEPLEAWRSWYALECQELDLAEEDMGLALGRYN